LTLVQMVESGLGLALIPELALRSGLLDKTGLIARPLAPPRAQAHAGAGRAADDGEKIGIRDAGGVHRRGAPSRTAPERHIGRAAPRRCLSSK
jgi:hypothetical protein